MKTTILTAIVILSLALPAAAQRFQTYTITDLDGNVGIGTLDRRTGSMDIFDLKTGSETLIDVGPGNSITVNRLGNAPAPTKQPQAQPLIEMQPGVIYDLR